MNGAPAAYSGHSRGALFPLSGSSAQMHSAMEQVNVGQERFGYNFFLAFFLLRLNKSLIFPYLQKA